jgi:ferric-dicitrate binding protein FerR (iron transport regulator)
MKEYLKYNSLDFAQDDKFIAWVKGNNEQNQFWEDFLREHPERTEVIQEAKSIVQKITIQKKEVKQEKIDHIWNTINKKTSSTPLQVVKENSRRSFLRPLIGIAASLLLLLGIFNWFNNGNQELLVECEVKEQLEHILPDGSTVTLNALSNLNYDKEKFASDRTLTLSGEAFFEVTKGSKFTVLTDQGSVQVLGTSFNVNTRDGLKVDCITGKVKVENQNSSSVILTPGKGVHFQKQNVNPYEFTGDKVVQWKTGIFPFENTKLENVFAELERQYDIKIEAEKSIRDKIYNGFFDKTNLDNALYSICWPMNLESKIEGKTVRIIKK